MHLDKQMAKYGGNKGVKASPSSCLNLGAPSTGEIGWGKKKGKDVFVTNYHFWLCRINPEKHSVKDSTQCSLFSHAGLVKLQRADFPVLSVLNLTIKNGYLGFA